MAAIGEGGKALREIPMVGIVGLLSVTIGAVVAYASDRFPAHVESLETGAGFLLLSGFALTGYALPVVL
jgi:hypothetical protein